MKRKDILQGWNSIAEYLSRDVRTAKRWEKQRGLPVRRTPGEGRANVYTFVEELDAWLQAAEGDVKEAKVAGEPEQLTGQSFAAEPTEEPEEQTEHVLIEPQQRVLAGWLSRRSRVLVWCGVAVGVVVVAFGMWELVYGLPTEHRKAGATVEAVLGTGTSGKAQELYLEGSYLFELRTPDSLQSARDIFERAIAADPKFAPAYGGLAKTYNLLREYSVMPAGTAYSLSKQAAEHALALDPKLPEAHAALGFEEFFWEWNSSSAESEFKRAITIDPNCSLAHLWYGSMLMHEARYDEAIAELNRAEALQPASSGVMATRAYAIGLSGRRREASDLLQEMLARAPDSEPLHFILAELSLQEPRDISGYLDHSRRFSELRHDDEQLKIMTAGAAAYRARGESAMWQSMLDTEESQADGHPTYQIARAEAALGKDDDALRDLEELKKEHDQMMIGLDIDTLLKPLRGEVRFERLAEAVGLPRPN